MNSVKKIEIKTLKNISLALVIALSITACATKIPQGTSTPRSYLHKENLITKNTIQQNVNNASLLNDKEIKEKMGLTYIKPLKTNNTEIKNKIDLAEQFSNTAMLKITTDSLPLKDFLHYVLGELLQVNYVLGDKVKDDNQSITLNLHKNISKRKLFSLSANMLNARGYVIRFDDGIYYIHQSEGSTSQGNIAYGYGKDVKHVPNTTSTIVQLVPFTYGMQTSLAGTLRQLIKIKANPDFQRNALILEGKRTDIIRALEFINLMDQPIFKNRRIGIYKTKYVSTDDLLKKLPSLLKQEGITVSAKGQNDQAVSLIPIERIGAVVLFANNQQVLARVAFWANQVDQPPSGNQLQYFIYQPQFSRAKDLGASLQVLINGGNNNLNNKTSAAGQNKKGNNKTQNSTKIVSASNENMSLVVDERANALIFNSTGDKYRQLLPLIKRLDVMPKQVILEVMIAEVKLSDVFKQGVEFALTNQGSATASGGFDLSRGVAGLKYVLSGLNGRLTLNLLQTNSHVNVLSRPSLLVRDGVTASITVGDDIPTVGEVISSPNVSDKTSVVYRKTGVELQVKPTINARGVIIMEINQKISNQADGGSTVAGSPIIFERSISTEVVAESGQTIVLGGLISESRTNNDNTVPFFSSIPLIGRLFDSTDNTKKKTELVVLVTPRVIESVDEWDEIKAKFSTTLTNLNIN